MNKEKYKNVTKRCCAVIRKEIKDEQNLYKKYIIILDKTIINDPLIKEENVQQEQYDMRERLWGNMFEEYINKLESLLRILNKKDDGNTTNN